MADWRPVAVPLPGAFTFSKKGGMKAAFDSTGGQSGRSAVVRKAWVTRRARRSSGSAGAALRGLVAAVNARKVRR